MVSAFGKEEVGSWVRISGQSAVLWPKASIGPVYGTLAYYSLPAFRLERDTSWS